jgi:hypothetical protein
VAQYNLSIARDLSRRQVLFGCEKLFATAGEVRPMMLRSSRTLGSGLALLNYEVIRKPGSYAQPRRSCKEQGGSELAQGAQNAESTAKRRTGQSSAIGRRRFRARTRTTAPVALLTARVSLLRHPS